MTPIDLVIRSLLDSKGFEGAQKASEKLAETINAGIGLGVGEKIVGWLEEVPKKIGEAVEEGIRLNATYEESAVLFERLLGSAEAAAERVAELREMPAIFDFHELEEADRVLQKLTKGVFATGDGLRFIGDVAAGTHNSFEAVAEAVGRLYAGLENGVSVERATMQLEHMGVINKETALRLNRTAESGMGVGLAFETIKKELGGFEGSAAKSMETINGQSKQIKENIDKLLATLTQDSAKGFLEWLKAANEVLEKMNHTMASPGFKKFMDSSFAQGVKSLLGTSAISQVSNFSQQAGALAGGGLSNVGNILGNEVGIAAIQAALAAENAQSPAERPKELTEGQRKMAEDLQKTITDAWREGMTDREKLEQEYLQRVSDIEDAFGSNQEEMQRMLLKNEELYDHQRILLRAQMDDEAEKNTRDTQEKTEQYRKELFQKEMQREQDLLRVKRDAIALERATLDADFRKPETQKRTERIALMEKEIKLLDEWIKKKEEQRNEETDAAAREALNQQVIGLGGEKRQLEIQRAGIAGQADPFSVRDQFTKATVELQDQWGTVAEQMANSFKDVFNSAISTISSGITGLIMGTMTWGQALQQIGMNILQTIIQAIITMGIRWVATQIMMAVAGKALQASMVAANVPLALAASAIWATPATLATIASYGAAAEMAPAFIAMAQGAVMAESIAGFKEGGYTGDGDPSMVAGLAHKGEFYFTAPQTAAIGRQNLMALASGAMRGGGLAAAMQSGSSGAAPAQVHIGYLGDKDAVREFFESAQGEKVIIDLFQRRRLDIGMNT